MKISQKLLMLLNIMDNFNPEYHESNITFDEDINDCLLSMYFFMMSSDDKYYQAFHEKYNKLTDEQKEFVKNDYINIINAQGEFEKVKRKGEIKYE